MPVLEVAFNVPAWVEAGVRTGQLQVFGGVVRDNSGRIVYMLREAGRSVRRVGGAKLAIVALAIAAAGAAAWGIWLLVNRRKAKTLTALESVESSMTTYLGRARKRKLRVDDVEALVAALTTFLELRRDPKFKRVQLSVPDDVYEKLRDLVQALQAFNESAHERCSALPEPPALVSNDGALEPLFDNLLQQVRYQGAALELVRAA